MYKRCIMILADGARADVMRDLLERGQLPAIAEHLAGPGSFREAVTAFPSTTGPAYLPFLTGCYPGTCNLPGIRWFDKDHYAKSRFSKDRFRSYVGAESFYMNGDLAEDKRTLFEMIPRSANVFSSVSRGVRFRGDRTKFSRIWYWYYAHLTDRWGMVDRAACEKILAALNYDPEFLFAVFPAIDEYSHLSSPFHSRTIEAYRELDRSVGRIVSALKRRGRWEETMLFIVSDHGLSETTRHFPLNQFLENSGLSVLYYPKIVFKWRFEAASMVSGNGMANVYLKNGNGWQGRAFWEGLTARKDRLIDRLLQQPEIDFLAAQREDGAVVVKGKKGEAVIALTRSGLREDRAPLPNRERGQAAPETMEGEGISYEVHGGDPFGYSGLPAAMTDRESLFLTERTDYPDAPAQLLQIFRSRRTGDLILSAAKGSDLRLRYEIHEHKSSHGSLHAEHMKIPIVTNVRLSDQPTRSVDVFPAVLKLLGRPVPAGIDGIDIS